MFLFTELEEYQIKHVSKMLKANGTIMVSLVLILLFSGQITHHAVMLWTQDVLPAKLDKQLPIIALQMKRL